MNSINMQSFYPEDLKITAIKNTDNQISISMKSQKHQHECTKCYIEMSTHHGTYVRMVQYLPILGKIVMLKITSYEYICSN